MNGTSIPGYETLASTRLNYAGFETRIIPLRQTGLRLLRPHRKIRRAGQFRKQHHPERYGHVTGQSHPLTRTRTVPHNIS
ncbi:MAG: hypothetical protein MZV64_59840 [Ignavibacteriales bacterium]|nr:hypothetical protein [Ignavibacteriales bacterium]